MASEFVNAYLKKREEEKRANPSSSVSDRSQFAQEYLSKRYEGASSDMTPRADANDIYYDFATGKSYSVSQRAATRRIQSAREQAQTLQKQADRYSNILMREPESGVLMPDYDAIVAANNSQNSLSLAARSRALAQKALADYEKQYRTQLDSYGPYVDGSGKDVAGQYNARKKAVDDANQAYEDAFADYQKKQQAADYARRQDDKRKALQNEWAQYKQIQADKSKAETDAAEAWKSYYSMLPKAEDFASNQQNPYGRTSYEDRLDKVTSNRYSEEEQIRDLVMTDEELAIMTYLRNTQGEDAAQRYYNSLGLNERLKKHYENAFYEFGDENPVGASVVSTWHNLANEIYGTAGIVKAKLSGQELDPDADYFKYGKLRDAARAGVMQDMGPTGQFVYQTLMSAVADSGVNGLIGAATGGSTWLGAGLTGASGFSDMVRQVKARGADDTQALVLGLIEGAAEVVTEKMGFDRLADLLTSKTPFKSALKSVLANMMSEFGEESITTVINQTADYLYGEISGRETEFTGRIEDYMAEGKTEGEALANALLDMGGDVLMDGLGGALGGVVMGGGSVAINKGISAAVAKYADYKYNQQQNASQTAQETTQAQQTAQETENQVETENRAQTAQEAETRARIERLAQETADAEMGEQAARQEMRQTEQQRVQQTTRQAAQTTENASTESVHNAAAVYGRDAASFESHYEGGTLQNYRRAFDAVYQAGKVNLSLEQVNQAGSEIVSGLSEQAKAEIWQAGRNAAAATVVPGVSKQYVGKMNHNQRTQVRILDAIGKKYGIQIDVVSSLDYGKTAGNAALVGRNHIVVASDAMNSAYVQAGVHELVHNLRRESSAYYDAFSSVVLDTLKKDKSFDLQAAIAERIRQYAEQGQQLSQEDALEEIVAEAAPAALTNREAMRAFVNENRSLAEKVRDFFVRFADELREIAAKYGVGNSRAEVDAMLKAEAQDLVNIAESLDMALSAAQEVQESAQVGVSETESTSGESEPQFSRKNGIEFAEDKYYDSLLDRLEDLKSGSYISVGKVMEGSVLNRVGLPAEKLFFDVSKINKALSEHGDHITIDTLKAIPDMLRNPVVIAEAAQSDTVNVFGDMEVSGSPILIGIMVTHDRTGMNVINKVRTIHARRDVTRLVTDESVLYLSENKKRTREWFQARDNVVPLGGTKFGVIRSIAYSDTSVNPSTGFSSETKTKFSLQSPVEETKDLVAVHNLTESKLQKALELGGFPMPSIAVTRTDVGHQTFGDISLVFGRKTIDPKANRKNVVYSADAWTPTFPTIEYQTDKNVHSRAYTYLNELARSLPSEYQKDIHMFINDPDYQLQRYGGESGLIDAAMENRGIRAAYAKETGHNVTMETRTETKGGISPRAAAWYEKILAIFDNDVERMTHMPIDQMIDQYGDKLFEIIPMRRMLPDFISNTAKFARGELEARQVQVEDLSATDKKISEMIDESGLHSWVKQLFSGIEGKRGVYNNKERFTAAGNRRSFDATHYPATLENIAKAMAGQNGVKSKNVSGFNGVKTLRAGLSETLNSVESMHEREGRIQQITQEQVDEATSRLNDELYALIDEIVNTKGKSDYDSLRAYDYAGATLMEIAETRYSAESIRSTFAKYGEQINEQTAQKVKNLLDRIADMPVNLFEAKPQRAVYFDEVKAAIIPESTSESLKSELKERVGQVIEYEDGDEQARLEALNSLEDVKFSLKDTSEVDEQAKALLDGVDVEYNAEVVKAYARSALRAADNDAAKINQQVRQAAGKILKDTASKYDRKTLESNMRAIVEAYARDGGEGVSQAAAEMAKAIIEQNTHLDTTLRDQYSALRSDLRENGVSLTESQKAEAASIYGSYNEFRKALMGTVKLTDKSMTLEARWDELSTMYPEIFRADTVEGDQINALMQFKQMMQPVYVNDFGMDMDTAAVDLGLRIQGDALSIAGAKEASKQLYGSAQKIESRVKKAYDAELKAQKKVKVAQFQEIAERLAEAKKLGDTQGYDNAMADYRKLIRKETGVKMPGGESMSPSAKMRFSQLAEAMQTAREANDTAAYQDAFKAYKELLKKERIQSTVVAPAVQDALNQARARFKASQETKEGTVKKQKATKRVIKQAKDLIDMLANKKKGVRVPRMMQNNLLTLLEGLDINGRGASNKGELTQQAAAMREQLTALRQTYQEIWDSQSKGEAPAVLDGLMMVMSEEQRVQLDAALSTLEQGGRFTLRDMTTEQLKALGDALTTVKQTVSTIGVLWRKGRYQNVAELADASIQEMGKRPEAKLKGMSAAGTTRDFLMLDMLEPVSYGERLGQAGSEIIQGLYEGERAKFGRLREAQEATAQMMEDSGVTGYDIGEWRKHVNTVRMGGHDVKLTDTQAMDIYLTAQRPQGKQHMLGDGIRLKTSKQTGAQVFTVHMTEEDIAKVSDLLSDKQKRLAHKMQGYLAGDVAKWGNDVTQQLYLYDYFTEQTYWPLTSDPNVLKTSEPSADRSLTAITQPGFMKPLTKNANNPVIIMDAVDVFNRHVAEMASYSGLAMPMTDALGYMNYKQRNEEGALTGSVKESMERLLGGGGGKYMVTLLQDLNHARYGDDLTHLSKLTGNYKRSAVSGKIRVVIQQPTAIARAAQEISPVYLAQGLKLGNKADIAEMQKYSALAWWKGNASGMDIGVGRSADQILWGDTSKLDTARTKVETAGGLIDAGKADDVTWAAMWRAVKRETQRIHPELQVGSEAYFKAVAERFDGIMDKTQVVDSIMHRSQIMRSQNGLIKELTAFQAEPIKSYNMLARSAMELGRNPKSKAAQTAAARSVLVFAANAALTALAEAAFDVFKHRDDDDPLMEYLLDVKKGFLKEYTDEFMGSWLDNLNVIAMIPGFSQAYEILTGGSAPEMMSFEGMSDAVQAAKTFVDHFVGDNKKKTTTYGAIAPVLKAASQITGLPIAGIMANTEMLAKVADPQWLNYKAVSGKFADNYEALYAAILEDDKRAITRIRGRLAADSQGASAKSPKQIDQGVANVLAEKDERIAQAYQLRKEGKASQLVALQKQIMADGFTEAMVTAAINRYENQAKTQEETTKNNDMNAQLTAKLFSYENLFAAMRTGSIEDVGIIAEYLEANSTAKDPAATIRSQVSGEFKQEYLDAVMNGGSADGLKKKLMSLGLTEDDLNGWVKSARYAELKEFVGEGDVEDAKQVAKELIDSGADVSDVVSSLNNKYKSVYIELVNSGRTAEAEKLQKDLESLGLIKKKTGQNYYRKDYMDKWVTDYNKKDK